LSYDIEAFNLSVTCQIEQLAAAGESSSDLLINLFAAYMAVPYKKFGEYIEKQKDKFDEDKEVTTKRSCKSHSSTIKTGSDPTSGRRHERMKSRSLPSLPRLENFTKQISDNSSTMGQVKERLSN
jgi:hypothetical protein